ncbi:MAG: radical SAM protein [Armatimonadetes bacterium]|nr:radical SAM protein [Armatimonadota bacterium]
MPVRNGGSEAQGRIGGPSEAAARGTEAAFLPVSALDAGPTVSRSSLARAAATAAELDFRNEVQYQELPCRTVINATNSSRVPFDFSLNPYRGCEFGCAYCYARYTHEYLDLEDWLQFERRVFVKAGAREALAEDLRRRDFRGRAIAIGTATDPYQPAEKRFQVTRQLLEVFAGRRGLELSITTKSDLILRDRELLLKILEQNRLQVNVTLTTLDRNLSRRLEPRAPRPDRRLRAVRELAAAGVPVGVFAMPLLPRITDPLPAVEELLIAARDAGAGRVMTGLLFLTGSSRRRYLPFLEAEFQELVPFYRRLYGAWNSPALQEYSRRKSAEIALLKERSGFPAEERGSRRPPLPPDQLSLDLEPPTES